MRWTQAARWAFVLLAFGARALVAQGIDPRTDSLIVRTERGDSKARDALAALARGAMMEAEQHRVDAATARANARMTLAMASPLSPPGVHLTGRETEWRQRAVRSLSMALAADSTDAWSAGQLEQLFPYPMIWMNPDRELKLLRSLEHTSAERNTQLGVTRVQLELEVGSPDSALAALARLPAAAVTGALGHHVAARVLFASGENATAEAEYYLGAQQITTPGDIALYETDIRWIAEAADTASWRAIGDAPGARAQWLRTFWNRKDMDDGRMPGSRLAEQFRRWRVALRDYRWDPDGSAARGYHAPVTGEDGVERPEPIDFETVNRLFPTNDVLDDRGRLYLRHGEPERKANLPGHEAIDDEVWSWATQPKATIVGFRRAGSLRFGMAALNFPDGDAMTICNLDPRFCVPMSPARHRIMVADYKRMRETAERTDGNPESYYKSADAIIQAYGVPGGGTLVVVAVPVGALLPKGEQRDSDAVASARLSVVVGDSATGQIVASLDTTRRWDTPSRVAKQAFLTWYLVVPTPVGSWDVSVIVGDSAHRAGSGIRLKDVPVVPLGARALTLSDPILGRANSGLSWRHNGELIPLNPTNAWRRDEPALLTYEIDGRVMGRMYETRYELWKSSGKPKAASNVITSKAAASAVTETVHRELSLKELDPGTYRLVIRVKDTVTGAESTRERMIPVRK